MLVAALALAAICWLGYGFTRANRFINDVAGDE